MKGIGLRRGVRFVFDEARQAHALLRPEGVQMLNDTAAAVILHRGDIDALSREFDGVDAADIEALVRDLDALAPQGKPVVIEVAPAVPGHRPDPVPYGMLAELTYRCPLRCPYCSNPLDLGGSELDTGSWWRVFKEARELGVLQLHLSGGEPLARADLTELIARARSLALYTNLVTSGIGLTAKRLAELKAAGLDHVQLSIQDSRPVEADRIAGIEAHERKLAIAGLVREADLPLSVNVVLHRHNLARLREIGELAASMGAERLELAHTQYYGWGLLNRAALLPSREQVMAADAEAAAFVASHQGTMEIVYVRPDYHDGVPKPCMNGWGSRQLVVSPTGEVMPCPAASVIPGLDPPNVLDISLFDIWYRSEAFNRFRGTAWMGDPCRACPRREIDFGGCRCQAFQLTGDAAATDPACVLSPRHDLVTSLIGAADETPFVPRRQRGRALAVHPPQTFDVATEMELL
ncbi:MAG TPA: pyrroloquinoline quinone biosynthesis protein PqqE [Candidatus Limnocylindrales bacterium]|nr:pyrroloquinoline quinone biosynthesis protein PqqE [Candidatus Limnocylindrales bacterium]